MNGIDQVPDSETDQRKPDEQREKAVPREGRAFLMRAFGDAGAFHDALPRMVSAHSGETIFK
jgi:hypothetical protein